MSTPSITRQKRQSKCKKEVSYLVISCVDDFKSKLDLVDIWRSKTPDGQFAVGDDEKNNTILIFVFIYIPKW